MVACQFSADGRRLLTLGLQGLLHIWDPLDTTEPKLTLGRLSQVHDAYCADFDPSGSSLITAFGKGAAQIWDIREGSILGLVVHDSSGGAIRTPHFSPDGKRILAVSGFDARIWSTETGQPLTQPLRHQNRRVSVDGGRFSSDGQAIVTWGMETNIYLWHGHTGQPLFPPVDVGETVKDAEFSSDGRRVVVVPLIGRLRLCDTRSGEVTKLSGTGGRDLYQGFAHFNSVGDQLITPSSSNEVAIWSIAQNGFLTVRFHHGGKITSARFSPDGKQLVTTSVDNTACIWNVLNGTLVCPPLLHRAGVTDASFSADGTKVLTTCDDFSAQVWNAWSGQRLTEPLQHSLVIWSASFDRSGTRVVTVSDDGTTRIWNAQTGEPIAEALGKPFRGVGAEFSSDGRFLIGAYVRDGVRVWELPEAPLAVPGWMLELAGAVADLGGGTGPTASIAATNLLRLKEQILNNPEENSYTRWARWFFADRETRTVSPSRHMTVPEYVQRRIKENTQSTLREATLLSPTNVFAFARLAELFARNSQSAADADWFSRYATNLAATDPEVLRTRESVVKKLRAAAEARQTAAAP